MELGIRPVTPAGARYVELCEAHAADFATRAAEHDREQTFPFENIAALKESGVLSAGLPEELGGFGIESTQDLVAGMNRLGRGDGSTAIAANMHIGTPWYVTRLWKDAVARGDSATADRLYATLGLLADTIVMVAATEAGTSVGWPLTEVTRAPDGWLLNGRKIFGTLSPAADILIVACRFKIDGAGVERPRRSTPDEAPLAAPTNEAGVERPRRSTPDEAPPAAPTNAEGGWGWAYAFVPRGTEGLTLHDDWDALGMRASGSQSLTFEDCFVPDAFFNPQERAWGGLDEGLLTIQVNANLSLSAAMVGIAEQARDLVIDQVTTRRKAPSNRILAERTGIQYQVAEMEIDLATARAMIERTAALVDAYLLSHSASEVQLAELQEVMCHFQTTKWVANRKAIDVVDRALTLSGGAGYFASSPLSRLYRDVRAGPFMQAYSPNEAREYIGRVTLGLGADLDL